MTAYLFKPLHFSPLWEEFLHSRTEQRRRSTPFRIGFLQTLQVCLTSCWSGQFPDGNGRGELPDGLCSGHSQGVGLYREIPLHVWCDMMLHLSSEHFMGFLFRGFPHSMHCWWSVGPGLGSTSPATSSDSRSNGLMILACRS